MERAAYASERAARHSRLVDPEQRLVARHLAKDWDDKLTAQRHLQEDAQRFVHTQSQALSPAQREAIKPLAQHMPALGQAPTTTVADRNAMRRQIVQRVMVRAAGGRERLYLTSEWVGGGTTAGITTRPMSRTEHWSDDPRRCERLRTLAAAGYRTVKITACLAQAGFRSPKQDRPLTRQTVMALMRRLGIHHPRRRPRPPVGQHEWRLSE